MSLLRILSRRAPLLIPVCWIRLDYPIWSGINTNIADNNWCNLMIRSTLIIKSNPFCINWINLDHPIWWGKNNDITDTNWFDPLMGQCLLRSVMPAYNVSGTPVDNVLTADINFEPRFEYGFIIIHENLQKS